MDNTKHPKPNLADPDFEPSDDLLQNVWPEMMLQSVRKKRKAAEEQEIKESNATSEIER